MKLGDRVGLLGAIPPDERWHCFDGADVFVLPSHRENFGLVVVEALARGCPALVTPETATGEYVIASGAGKVVPRDPASFAEAIDGMLDAGRGTGEKSMESLQDTLSWERATQSLVTLYERMTGE